MSDLDLDALELRAHKRIETPGAPWITGSEVLALIQRLREAEAEVGDLKALNDIMIEGSTKDRARIAQLERVREAVEPLVRLWQLNQSPKWRDEWGIVDALADLESKT